MYYLVDTNVFLHTIDSEIGEVASKCKESGSDITITQTILDELCPGIYKECDDPSSKEVYNSVSNYVDGRMGFKLIKKLDINDITEAKKELKKIRDRYYKWTRDPIYLNKLIQEGKLTKEDIRKKSFRNKDLGECELVAIAVTDPDIYEIVSNDRGRVYMHPDQNIYDSYKDRVRILTGEEWLEIIK